MHSFRTLGPIKKTGAVYDQNCLIGTLYIINGIKGEFFVPAQETEDGTVTHRIAATAFQRVMRRGSNDRIIDREQIETIPLSTCARDNAIVDTLQQYFVFSPTLPKNAPQKARPQPARAFFT